MTDIDMVLLLGRDMIWVSKAVGHGPILSYSDFPFNFIFLMGGL